MDVDEQPMGKNPESCGFCQEKWEFHSQKKVT
jgi:hypothetical protein